MEVIYHEPNERHTNHVSNISAMLLVDMYSINQAS